MGRGVPPNTRYQPQQSNTPYPPAPQGYQPPLPYQQGTYLHQSSRNAAEVFSGSSLPSLEARSPSFAFPVLLAAQATSIHASSHESTNGYPASDCGCHRSFSDNGKQADTASFANADTCADSYSEASTHANTRTNDGCCQADTQTQTLPCCLQHLIQF